MANTKYKELVDALFDKVKDYDFVELTQQDAYTIVKNYIRPAVVKFENSRQDLSDRDDLLEEFNFKLTDDTFEILVNYMVIEWLDSNYIKTGMALKARLTTADFHALKGDQMLQKSMDLRASLVKENEQSEINKSYYQSDLFNLASGKRV